MRGRVDEEREEGLMKDDRRGLKILFKILEIKFHIHAKLDLEDRPAGWREKSIQTFVFGPVVFLPVGVVCCF